MSADARLLSLIIQKPYSDLNHGDHFELNGMIFIKTKPFFFYEEKYNSVCSTNGEFYYCPWESIVSPVQAIFEHITIKP